MSTQPFLPKFSSPADIDEFVTKLEAFERGDLGPDAFRAFRLTRGVYGQRQEGVQMVRVKLPYGIIGREGLEAVADVADRYSRGYGHVTTRQNFQLHFIKMSDAEAALRRLDEAGLTTREACGNAVRTITACEVASVCSTAPFDVSPYAEALTRYFLRHPLAATLPRKFKIAFSGCPHDCAKGAIHDIGFIATVKDGAPGFRVLAAGGLSTQPVAAIELHDFVPAASIARVGEAVLRLFDRAGNRQNKHRARLKYVRKKLGEQGFRDEYAKIAAEVEAEARAELTLPAQPARTPAPPVDRAGPAAAGYMAWRAASIFDQKQAGYAGVYIRLKLGDITSAQMRGLGKVLDRFGDGSARLTIDQNLFMPWVDVKSLPALYDELRALDLAHTGLHTASDITSCPGAESCNLAVTASRALGAAIGERLEAADAKGLRASADAVIKISGCPNSCGQHHIADIGFHGGARRENGVTVPVYQLHLGGGVDASGAHFGRQVIKLVARRVPDAVVRLLALFDTESNESETVAAYFRRVEPARVVAALGDLAGPASGRDESFDIGEDAGFSLHEGEGECAS